MGAALTVTDLVKNYGRFKAVRGVSFSVQTGIVFGLLGPNGSGKSSILHCVTGVVAPTSGSIKIRGLRHDSRAAKERFGLVPDDLALPTNLTGAEFLDLVVRLQPAVDVELQQELVELLDLGSAMRKLVAEYSHGMKRKIQMVAALCHSPTLLILDEPFRGLDPEATVVLRTLIESFITGGGGVLLATHDLVAAETFCDHVAVVAAGELAATGPPASLMEEYGRSSLESVFLAASGLEERTTESQRRLKEIRLDRTGGKNGYQG